MINFIKQAILKNKFSPSQQRAVIKQRRKKIIKVTKGIGFNSSSLVTSLKKGLLVLILCQENDYV